MPRAVRMTVCSGCIQDAPHKEMYTVSRFMHKGKPDSRNMYTTMYCAKCVKKDKENYHEIVGKPMHIINVQYCTCTIKRLYSNN